MRTLTKISISLVLSASALAQGGSMFAANRNPCFGTNYCAYQGALLIPLPAAPNLGTYIRNGALLSDNSYTTTAGYTGSQPLFGRCTDTQLSGTQAFVTHTVGQGGAGNVRGATNSDTTLVQINGNEIMVFNPNTMVCGPVTGLHAGSGYTITTDMNTAGGGDANHIVNFGRGTFDVHVNSSYLYADFALSAATQMQVGKVTINTTSGAYTDNGIFADLSLGLPVGANVSPWQANHAYTNGTYVSFQGSFPAWSSTHAYTQGDIIVPTTGNPGGCSFKANNPGGTSGSTQPTWPNTCGYGPVSGTDGTVHWQGTSTNGTFVYQLISANCTSGSSTPAFIPVGTGHPDMMSQVTDGSVCVWLNVGPDVIITNNGAVSWTDFSWLSQDNLKVCMGISTNNYGWLASPAGGTNLQNYSGASQGTGIYSVCYDVTNNLFHTLNTATGIQSTTTCIGGTGYACSGGSWKMLPDGGSSVITPASCGGGGFLHAGKDSLGADYVQLPFQTSTNCNAGAPGTVVWRPFQAFNAATSVQFVAAGVNHGAIGERYFVNIGQAAGINGGFAGGAYGQLQDLSNPPATPNVTWMIDPCDSRHYTPGIIYTIGPCEFADAYDQHINLTYNPNNSDSAPVCGVFINYATLNPNPFAPYQGEVFCMSVTPNKVWDGNPIVGQQTWRLAHGFCTGTNSNFFTQFCSASTSTDGRFLFWSTDNLCGFGNTLGTNAALYPVGGTLCGYNWQASFNYSTLGTLINPFGSTTGSGTNYGVWKISATGISAATNPFPGFGVICNSSTAGTVETDSNGVGYTCVGAANPIGEVLVVRLGY
jgi:hypothetical protein